jgi:peptide deformylase
VSILRIHLLGSPALRARAAEITAVDEGVRGFVADLFETMHAAKGVGLAANQVGDTRRVAVVETEAGRHVLINPVIRSSSGRDRDEEGCLSIPDIYADVDRAGAVTVEATDETGERRTIEATGLLARAIQHEIDHLDGLLFIDRVGPIKRRFLIRQWEKSREGHSGYIREIEPEAAGA